MDANSRFRTPTFGFLLPAIFLTLAIFSPLSFAQEAYSENPGTDGNGNHIVGPEYRIDPDLTDRGNPKGKRFEFSMPLADSKIFRGDDRTLDPASRYEPNERSLFTSPLPMSTAPGLQFSSRMMGQVDSISSAMPSTI